MTFVISLSGEWCKILVDDLDFVARLGECARQVVQIDREEGNMAPVVVAYQDDVSHSLCLPAMARQRVTR